MLYCPRCTDIVHAVIRVLPSAGVDRMSRTRIRALAVGDERRARRIRVHAVARVPVQARDGLLLLPAPVAAPLRRVGHMRAVAGLGLVARETAEGGEAALGGEFAADGRLDRRLRDFGGGWGGCQQKEGAGEERGEVGHFRVVGGGGGLWLCCEKTRQLSLGSGQKGDGWGRKWLKESVAAP